MITKFDVRKQDIEDAIEIAVEDFNREHNKHPDYLVLGRMAYEEFRDMSMVGHRADAPQDAPDTYQNLTIVLVEDPPNTLLIGCKPD